MEIQEFNMDFFSLKGKNAIVTGGNTGLGRAFSLALATAGANVFIPNILPDDPDFNKELEARGAKVGYMEADITADGVPAKVVQACVDQLGSVDILVNCAGICLIDDVLHFGRDKWDAMMAINLTAPFEMIFECAKYMIPQKSGKIINICSLFTYLGGKWSPAYGVSKHGMAGLVHVYCDELGEHNIQINGIAPGYFKTKAAEKSINDPETSKWIVDHTPAGRWGDVADLMGTTVFLASRASDFVNGAIVSVDGGYLVR